MLSTGLTLTRDAVPIAELTNIGLSHSRDALESTVHSALRIVPLRNGGFETAGTGGAGDPDTWALTGEPATDANIRSSTDPHSGGWCLYLKNTSGTDVGRKKTLANNELLELGKTYRISCWTSIAASPTPNAQLLLSYGAGATTTESIAFAASADWTKLSVEHTVTVDPSGNPQYLSIIGVMDGYIDDVRIHEVGAKTFQRGGIDGEELPIEGFFLGYDDAATEDIIDDLLDTTDTLSTYAINITDADAGVTTITGDAFLTDLNITAGASEHAAFTGTIRWAGAPTYAYVP